MKQEEKARAYDEALERARKIHSEIINNERIGFPGQIEDIFPQLSKSEDENIMETLIDFFDSALGKDLLQRKCGLNSDAVLAYLEKQKEPAVDKEGMYYYLGGKFIYCGYPATEENPYDFAMSQQEKQKESLGDFIGDIPYSDQKEQIPYIDFVIKPHKGDDTNPYDMSASEAEEYTIKRGFGIPFIDGEVYVDERHIIQTVGNILRWADEHPKEQKPEWSEEDEKMRNALLNLLKIQYAQDYSMTEVGIEAGKFRDWLKSLRPQLKVEWSKEDETMINHIIEALPRWANGLITILPSQADEYVKRLKSLRPQSHWKPSEEQIYSLGTVVKGYNECTVGSVGYRLKELYEQLKKL